MNETEVTKEQVFQRGIDAARVLIEKLKPYCQTFDELIAMLEHAMKNDGQFRLLFSLVVGQTQQSKR